MTIQEAYNNWSEIYDTNQNKTRDLEAVALRHILEDKVFENILEIGCGTGKNTMWLLEKTQNLTGVDFSKDMLEKAKQKISSDKVQFVWADIQNPWQFDQATFDLITFSLVLEHIADLSFIFNQAHNVLKEDGLIYIGELHPFKQYMGSKARFEIAGGTFELDCFTHHISEFYSVANAYGFDCIYVNEWFDDADRVGMPRILTLLFRKK